MVHIIQKKVMRGISCVTIFTEDFTFQERVHHDWMFKLVGSEVFEIGNTKCVIKIEPVGGFSYEYSLEVCSGVL